MTAPSIARPVQLQARDFQGPDGMSRLLAHLNGLALEASRTLTAFALLAPPLLRVAVVTPDSAVEAAFPIVVTHGLAVPPSGLSVVRMQSLSQPDEVFASACMPTWEVTSDGTQLRIRYLTGLQTGRRYLFTFRMDP